MTIRHAALAILLASLVTSGLQARNLVLPFGQPETMRFDRIGLEEGLQNLSVSRIVQDRYGFLWFGTQNGLHRYDGKSFRIFENDPYRQDTLSHNLVQTLYVEDRYLWIGTYQGLNRLDLATYRIQRLEPQADNPRSLSHAVVTAIYRDSRQRLWAGTLDGLNLLDESVGGFTRYMAQPGVAGKLQDKIIRSIVEDGSGNLWIGTGGGLHRYNESTGSFEFFSTQDGLGSPSVMCLLNDRQGRLWAGCWGGGLSLLDPATMKFTNLPLPDNRLYCLAEGPGGSILAGSWGGGLFAVQAPAANVPAAGLQVQTYLNDRTDQRSLSNNTVYSLLVDNTGMLWIGTNGGGANRFNPRHLQFRHFAAGNDAKDVLPSGRLMCLTRESGSTILASIYNSGLAEIDTASGACTLYSSTDPKDWIPDNIVNDILVDSKGRTWLATNNGLAVRQKGEKQFRLFDSVLGNQHVLPDHIFYALFEDREGSLWIGTYSHGVIQWNQEQDIWNHYHSRSGEGKQLSNDLVSDIQQSPQGGIWIGTYGGLNRLNQRDGSIKTWYHNPDDLGSISSNSIRQILVDSRDNIWIATIGGGINLYDQTTGTFSHLLKEDGLSNNSIAGMLELPAGQFWIATREGLTHYDQASGACTRYGMSSGLLSHDFTSNILANPDGSLILGHAQGITVMSAKPGPDAAGKATLTINAARFGATGSREPAEEQDCLQGVKSVNLAWNQNQVELEFRYLEFGSVPAHRYSWKLEGFDADWCAPQAKTTALYSNLRPGTYAFKVRASEHINDPAPAETSLLITIPWHPLAHPLALGAYIALGLLLVLGFGHHYRRLRRLAAQARQNAPVPRRPD